MTISAVAIRKMREWLANCLMLGWSPAVIPELIDLWWLYHDDDGNLYPPGQQRPAPGESGG